MQVAATPRGLPDPGAPPTPERVMSRWNSFLGSLAAGTHLADAMLKHYITRAEIEACVRLSGEERQRFDDARLAALKRSWTVLQFEDIFERIAGGMKVRDAVREIKGAEDGAIYSQFNKIVIQDKVINEQYMGALKSRALLLAEENLEIADDDSNDVLYGDKGPIANTAAVNRSKLRVETRQKLMGNWFPKLFGEKQQQTQVNVQVNYAGKLEEARARALNRQATPARIEQPVIEAAFRELAAPAQEDEFAWLDAPAKDDPLDTTWLEG